VSNVRFADNLYGNSEKLAHIGCGLLGFCERAFWYYERHSEMCAPGKWRVSIAGSEPGDFFDLLPDETACAVVDDFGNLRRVTA
jgi:hypothetical protein